MLFDSWQDGYKCRCPTVQNNIICSPYYTKTHLVRSVLKDDQHIRDQKDKRQRTYKDWVSVKNSVLMHLQMGQFVKSCFLFIL